MNTATSAISTVVAPIRTGLAVRLPCPRRRLMARAGSRGAGRWSGCRRAARSERPGRARGAARRGSSAGQIGGFPVRGGGSWREQVVEELAGGLVVDGRRARSDLVELAAQLVGVRRQVRSEASLSAAAAHGASR